MLAKIASTRVSALAADALGLEDDRGRSRVRERLEQRKERDLLELLDQL